MITDSDYQFWLAVYRAIQALAAAIKRYKIDPVRQSRRPKPQDQ